MKSEREKITNMLFRFMELQGYTRKKPGRQSYILDSYYFTYVNTVGNKDHIKFDINYVMRSHIYKVESRPIVSKAFEVESGVNALSSIEIYGSKINALNNRVAVRDLYDVWTLVQSGKLNDQKEKLRKAVIFYHGLTSDEVSGNFDLLATNKLSQHSILRELVPVLKKGEFFILKDALELVRGFVTELMDLAVDELAFIKNFNNGDYYPELLFNDSEVISRIIGHPMARWKVGKLKKL